MIIKNSEIIQVNVEKIKKRQVTAEASYFLIITVFLTVSFRYVGDLEI